MSLPNTANAIARGSLFPAELVPGFLNQVKGRSSIAALCGSDPIPFNGKEYFTFNMDNDVDIVAEAGAKSAGGGQVGSVTIVPVKIEYGMRVSDEFIYGSEEVALNIMRAFSEGWSKKVARGIDIMAMHGVNPRTGLAASGTIGNNHLDYAAGTKITYLGSSSTAYQNVDAAIAGINAYDHEATGAIMGSTIRAALAAMVDSDNRPVFPELAWGGRPGSLNGLKTDFNGPTVEFNSAKTRAIIGDFANFFKWGIAKELPIQVIQYGNPDNDATAGDLAGHNQVYLRGEAYVGWGILDATAFATIATT
jgi:HK97 family phage major capsid protein